ncbi:hypothetical protein F5B22DRAFT_643516 [Xylaria bambusicola]|uniref:uncharacterized protein n=1 Tax=Xylaria bambusicola TaxID=326684 RepID=UPI0020077EE6|nr:uncharacterized protein F5B22DRAFT_643516 [Xylaria bambusicola]KAI0521935.1 hypothetical protein F5B22DRAFT_643516 [Xylaria bambusicola]
MAEIVGLISSIITFVEFGFKIVSIAKDVRGSAQGTTAEVRELDLVIAGVQHWNDLVKEQHVSGQLLSKDELYILEMVDNCEQLVGKLRGLINTLKARADARSQTLESVRISTQSFLKQAQIKYLRSQLDTMAAHIQRHVANAIDEKRYSSILKSLAEIRTSHSRMGVHRQLKLDLILKNILALTNQNQEAQGHQQTQSYQQIAGLGDLKKSLEQFRKEQKLCAQQLEILKSLYFPELRRRWSQIPKAELRTNEWVYEPEKTSFLSWLESLEDGDGLFYITGKAGSGKSTLMKSIAEDHRTVWSLRKWAGMMALYTASYYFWNQGTETQKSGRGLFQSLLYQIFRRIPELIIPHIKICASSRPGRQYEAFLPHNDRSFDIAEFTKEDMRIFVDTNLQASTRWRQLVVESELACRDIIHMISTRASGVWIWVFLVTKDIVREAEKCEGVATLRRIVDSFPDDLYEYFERMIKQIPKLHREQMAQIFLIMMEALRPLPLYAFSLLEREAENENYAIYAPIRPMEEQEIELGYVVMKNRVRNRCGDLLTIHEEDLDLQSYLWKSVEFLHRTVADFLREYEKQLRTYLEKKFDPLVSLMKIYLGLLKMTPTQGYGRYEVIGFTDEVLLYAHEFEKMDSLEEETILVPTLDELDRVISYHVCDNDWHWTNERQFHYMGRHLVWEYEEGGQCNFLALAVQARLVKYVRFKLAADQRNMIKLGRPLLDYALRPFRSTLEVYTQDRSGELDHPIDIGMVELLLRNRADPNQPVSVNDNKSVWVLFLESMRSMMSWMEDSTINVEDMKQAWYQAAHLLVKAGARADCQIDMGASHCLIEIFGQEKAAILTQGMKQREAERERKREGRRERERESERDRARRRSQPARAFRFNYKKEDLSA